MVHAIPLGLSEAELYMHLIPCSCFKGIEIQNHPKHVLTIKIFSTLVNHLLQVFEKISSNELFDLLTYFICDMHTCKVRWHTLPIK